MEALRRKMVKFVLSRMFVASLQVDRRRKFVVIVVHTVLRLLEPRKEKGQWKRGVAYGGAGHSEHAQ